MIALSESGRAPKVQPAIFALAACAGFGDDATRAYALGEGLRRVCRTGSHLLDVLLVHRAVPRLGPRPAQGAARLVRGKPVRELAYQALKYQNRDGFTHRDVFRLAHPLAADAERAALYAWIVKGDVPGDEHASLALLRAHAAAKASEDADAATCAELVRTSGLPREALPSAWLKEPRVWEALLPALPMTALIRNLATLTRVGLLTPKGEATAAVIARITDRAALRKARIHPIALLAALTTYASGRGARGSATWTPVPAVVDALDAAFGLAFENVEPTGARTLIGLDVSGSMSCGTIAGIPGITPRAGRRQWRSRSCGPNATCASWRSRTGSSRSRSARDESVASVVQRTERRSRSWARTARCRCSTRSNTGSRSTCSSS